MADNRRYRGIRWVRSKYGPSDVPLIESWPLASGYVPTLTVGGNPITKNLRRGDPVVKLATGYVDVAAGAESDVQSAQVYGVIMGFEPMYDAIRGKKVFSDIYPAAGIVYGTNFELQTRLLVCPVESAYWEMDADDDVTATTYQAYLALRGENCNHTLDVTNAADCDPMLDISTVDVANTLLWRIHEVSRNNPENTDFTGLYVKVTLEGNVVQAPAWNALGI